MTVISVFVRKIQLPEAVTKMGIGSSWVFVEWQIVCYLGVARLVLRKFNVTHTAALFSVLVQVFGFTYIELCT